MPQQSVKVTINGTEFSLRGDSAERTQRAAAFVDAQMTMIRGKAPEQSTATIAILAALNAAEANLSSDDSLRLAAERMEKLAEEVESRAV